MNGNRDEKNLTEREKNRLDNFNTKSEKLINEGYEKHDLTYNATKANIVGALFGILLSGIFVLIYYLLGKSFDIPYERSYLNVLKFFLIVMFFCTFVHEGIHGLTWGLFSKNHLKDIEFGVIWKTFNPYCTCKQPLKKSHYILGSLMPCIILGIIPSIIAFITNNSLFLAFGVLQILAASGDLLINVLIIKNKSSKKEKLYFDHPTEIGLVFFDK